MAVIWAVPAPAIFAEVPYLNWASLAAVIIVLFYIRLSIPLTIGMTAFTALCFFSIASLDAALPGKLVPIAAIAFVILWIGQFYGHKVEGKKPSFFKDIQFLMIGPAWVMAFIFTKLGIKY